jgi:hypothetical protein
VTDPSVVHPESLRRQPPALPAVVVARFGEREKVPSPAAGGLGYRTVVVALGLTRHPSGGFRVHFTFLDAGARSTKG